MTFQLRPSRKNKALFPVKVFKNKGDIPLSILMDTGAHTPVWTAGATLLNKRYPDAYKTSYQTVLGGFGGPGTLADVYIIPDFCLTDGTKELHYKNLYIIESSMNQEFDMIISFSMLNHLSYEYTYVPFAPTFKINLDQSIKHLFVKPVFNQKDPNIFSHINVFVQDPAIESTNLFHTNN